MSFGNKLKDPTFRKRSAKEVGKRERKREGAKEREYLSTFSYRLNKLNNQESPCLCQQTSMATQRLMM